MEQAPIDQPGFRRTLATAVVAPLIIMALLAGALLWQINSYRVATRSVIRSDRTIAQANQLQKLLVDMETGLRGYLLTGADEFLAPYNQALPQIEALANNLNTRVADKANQSERIMQVLQDYLQWRQYAERTLQLRREGGDYTSLVTSASGKQIMDDIRAQMSAFIQAEESQRDIQIEHAQQTTQVVIYGSLGLALLAGGLLAFFSRRQLVVLSRSYGQAFGLAHERAGQVAEQRERLRVTLASIGDAVIVTDTEGRVTFVNTAAQTMTGWPEADAQGQPLEQVFAIVNEETRREVENPVAKVLHQGAVVGLANHTILLARNGAEIPIDDSAAPIRDADGRIVGVVLVFRDIAERKQAEQAQAQLATQIEQERQRLNVIVAHVPGVVWEAWGQPDAASQQIDFVSDYVEPMLGYSVGEWLATPNFWLTIVHPDDRERAAAEAAAIFAGGADGTSEFRWLARDGRALWVEAHSAVINDAAGKPVGMRGVTMDITKRKQAEQAIRESEERFRAVFDNSPIGIGVARDGIVLDGNQAFLRLFGYADIGELQGHSLTDLVIPALRAEIGERTIQRQRGAVQPTAYETIGLRKDGSEFPYSVHVGRIMLPDGPAAVAFCTDISDRQRADTALRASEQRYRELADAMPLVVWTAKPNGDVDYFNQRWLDYTGLTLKETYGWDWRSVIHPDDLQQTNERWSEAVKTGQPYEIEYRWKRADGIYHWQLGRALPVPTQ